MAVNVRHHKGKWWIFINHKGKRKAKCIGNSKRAAIEVAGKIEAKLKLGDLSLLEKEEKLIRFDDYATEWLRTSAAVRCKPSTAEEYERVYVLHLQPMFGAKQLPDITREHVKRLLADKLASGLSRSRVKVILNLLSAILNSAVEDGYLPANPGMRLGRTIRAKNGLPETEIHPLTKEELALFLATVREHFSSTYPLFLLLARTGLRIGEALALKWSDIDFHGSFIDVKRSWRRKRLSTPKNGKSRRVDMSRQLKETLEALLVARKEEAWRRNWEQLPEWVFCNADGQMLIEVTVRTYAFHPALTRSGLRRIRIHDLRHTYASLLIQQGESLAYVKDQMGHHSIKITVDTYGHLIPGSNRQAVDRLDDTPSQTATIRNPDATAAISTVAVVADIAEKTRLS